MEVVIQPSPNACAAKAARLIANLIQRKPNAVLGLATGGTPVGLYQELIRLHEQEGLDFRHVTTFNLDEYVGLPADHPASYHAFMWRELFSRVNIASNRIYIPDGMTTDIPLFCSQYEDSIRRVGGIDLQILGIGTDGHIGFNEPSSSLRSRTRLKTLTERTRADNARFFTDGMEPPRHCITMGIGTIMEARTVVLLAFGAKKADAIAATVEGPISAMVPGSVLQWHPTAKVLIDEPAAAKLSRADYYRWVYENKPSWQMDQ
jgi:glucosamine-6-phosphate deaminase